MPADRPGVATLERRQLLTTREAMSRLRVGKTTLFRMLGTGEIESMRIGRARRIPADAIDEYIARRMVSAVTGE